MPYDPNTLTDFAEAFAFLGNSLLAPMNQTDEVGIDPAFWAGFQTFGDDGVKQAVQACLAYAEESSRFAESGGDPVQRVSVEYTRLFVGPPKPAAAPWETFYRNGGAAVGFGQATFEMRGLLREAGLEVSNENNQYADHIGIELLYLSVLCSRAAAGTSAPEAAAGFAEERILSWIDDLRSRAAAAEPGGYIDCLLGLAAALAHALPSFGSE